MTKREKIAAQIRALRAKTVENGCTEAEAIASAEMLAKLLEKHNMTVDEAELRANEFQHHSHVQDDFVGERLWRVAQGIAYLTGVKLWVGPKGSPPTVNFFGFDHEVEIASYLLEICRNAMAYEQGRLNRQHALVVPIKRRRLIVAFLDGMAERLRQRLRELKPPELTGTGLVVLRDQLIEAAMPVKTTSGRTRGSRELEAGYQDGRRAANLVALNPGISGSGVTAYIT